MAKNKRILFKSKEQKDVQAVAEFLHQLADKLAGGELTFQRGSDETRMAVGARMAFKLKAKEKKKKRGIQQNLKINLKWYEDESEGITLG
jgi:amphi-Trp domain-containing protein